MSDVALVVGHHPNAPGAALTLGGHSLHEHDLWIGFARELGLTLEAEGITPSVVQRPNKKPDQALADRVNATEADAAIELHFNAASSEASGTEMLHWTNSTRGARLAWHLQKHATASLGLPSRGRKGRRGFPFLQRTAMPAVICEPAFGSTPGDAWALLTRQAGLMKAYRDALSAFLTEDG
jgi:N-acetylmuramoyl-L-alanine amidase